MKTIDIYGENRYEKHSEMREACRGILIKDGKMLMSYEVNTDQWFIPGGGVENNESLQECCARELAEETGTVVIPKEHFLTINEYYEEWLFISHYFICDYVGETERKLTEREMAEGLEPIWIPIEEAINIFSKHQDYAAENEMKRGAYLRGYKALLTLAEEKTKTDMKNINVAIIFDLDGTLWDSTGCACNIWNRVLEKHNDISFRMTKEKAEQLMGKTMEDIGRILFPELSADARNAIIDEFGDEEVAYLKENGAILYDGLEEVLKELYADYKLYIVSNCQDGYVPAFLHSHKLGQYFADIEMSGRTGLDKGNNIKLIMERNNIESAVYIGDTEGDEKAARFAGIPFIYAKYGFGNAISPDAVITDIRELPECIRRTCQS